VETNKCFGGGKMERPNGVVVVFVGYFLEGFFDAFGVSGELFVFAE